tara:strand:+ start:1301 stop:1948 length:648 start_codon:yes stop_codon:yes gene_type:complete
MGLGGKESAQIHDKTGADLTKMKDKYDASKHHDFLEYEETGSIMYQLQLMQNDIDELRRFVETDEIYETIREAIPTGLLYSSGWYIPVTATDWMNSVTSTKAKEIDGYFSPSVGFKSTFGVYGWCEKIIPIGFRADSAIVYGLNGGSTSQKFTCTVTAINANTNTSLGSLTNHGSTQTFSSQITGDGVKCITISSKFGNSTTDVIYGAKINLTQV